MSEHLGRRGCPTAFSGDTDLTLAEVKTLDPGSDAGAQFAGELVPTFEATLAAVKGTGVRLLLDIKDSSLVADIVTLVQDHDMSDDVIVGPRDVQALRNFQALDPDLATLGFIATPADADAFIAAGSQWVMSVGTCSATQNRFPSGSASVDHWT